MTNPRPLERWWCTKCGEPAIEQQRSLFDAYVLGVCRPMFDPSRRFQRKSCGTVRVVRDAGEAAESAERMRRARTTAEHRKHDPTKPIPRYDRCAAVREHAHHVATATTAPDCDRCRDALRRTAVTSGHGRR